MSGEDQAGRDARYSSASTSDQRVTSWSPGPAMRGDIDDPASDQPVRARVVSGGALERLYPESAAGGFSRHDGSIAFFGRVNGLLNPRSRVLDYGAGRGAWTDADIPAFERHLRAFHERVERVDGVDVDDVVLENAALAEAHVIGPTGPIPYPDATFDVVVADWVLEHVQDDDAAVVAAEILRVLKPGGWLAARTPNKWGLTGLGARVVPNRMHVKVLSRLQPRRRDVDVFPVAYTMNTRPRLRELFAEAQRVVVYGHASEPRYFGSSIAAWRVVSSLYKVTPSRLAPTLMVFVQKAEA